MHLVFVLPVLYSPAGQAVALQTPLFGENQPGGALMQPSFPPARVR